MPPLRLLVTKKNGERVFDALIRVWAVASVALFVVVVVMRVVNGPGHDDAWLTALVIVVAAPLWLMLLNLVFGWLWFVLWLLARPFPRLRGSRFMNPNRWGEPPE